MTPERTALSSRSEAGRGPTSIANLVEQRISQQRFFDDRHAGLSACAITAREGLLVIRITGTGTRRSRSSATRSRPLRPGIR